MGLLRERRAAGGRRLAEAPAAVEGRNRDEEVAPYVPDLVLDRPLLVARAGIAGREREAAVGGERRERLGGPHRAPGLAADAGGVVEDDAGGRAADILEYVPRRLADALGVLAGEHLGEPRVGEREREREAAQAPPRAEDAEAGPPKSA